MSLWICPTTVSPPFVEECVRGFCEMEKMFDPLCRTISCRIVDQSTSKVVDNESKFAESMDVSNYKPENLKVNINGRSLTIEGKAELKEENAYSMKIVENGSDEGDLAETSFTRQYVLPEDVHLDALRSTLADNGQLSIEAPKLTKPPDQQREAPQSNRWVKCRRGSATADVL